MVIILWDLLCQNLVQIIHHKGPLLSNHIVVMELIVPAKFHIRAHCTAPKHFLAAFNILNCHLNNGWFMQPTSEGILKFSTQYVDDIILIVTFFFLWHKLRLNVHCTLCRHENRCRRVDIVCWNLWELWKFQDYGTLFALILE